MLLVPVRLTTTEQRLLRFCLNPLCSSDIRSRQRRYLRVSFILDYLEGKYQILVRFREGLKANSLPKDFVITRDDFEVIVFRQILNYCSGFALRTQDCSDVDQDIIRSLVLTEWQEKGYIDERGKLTPANKNYGGLVGVTVLSPRAAKIRLLEKIRKVRL